MLVADQRSTSTLIDDMGTICAFRLGLLVKMIVTLVL